MRLDSLARSPTRLVTHNYRVTFHSMFFHQRRILLLQGTLYIVTSCFMIRVT